MLFRHRGPPAIYNHLSLNDASTLSATDLYWTFWIRLPFQNLNGQLAAPWDLSIRKSKTQEKCTDPAKGFSPATADQTAFFLRSIVRLDLLAAPVSAGF